MTNIGLNVPGLLRRHFELGGNIDNNSKSIFTLIKNYETKLEQEQIQLNLKKLINIKVKSDQGRGLLKADKTEIRKHINKIKEIIDSANISKSKSNAIYKKINSLLKEIDRFGTNLDIIMGGMVEIAIYTSQITKIAKPVISEVKEILQIVYSNKAKEMGIVLPKPDVQKLIEVISPTKE